MSPAQRISRRQFVRVAAAGGAAVCLSGCAALPGRGARSAQPQRDPEVGTWDELADLALARVRRGGAEYGDVRIVQTRQQSVRGMDRRITSVSDRGEVGFGVRALYLGAWGFAASSIVAPEEVRRVADLACEIARASAPLQIDPVRLAGEPVHRAEVATPRVIEPFEVPLAERSKLLLDTMELLHAESGVARSNASLWAQRDVKLFASTEGSRIRFDLLATQGGFSATAVHDGRFASRRFSTPYLRVGNEQIRDADFFRQAQRVAAQAVEKVRAPQIDPGAYDLVLDPEHLSLTIHESCGHPSELDRVLGYEANYAGTSFLTPEKLGTFRYGSKHVTLMADNTEPGTLCATGFDDDGVECQRWPIVAEGVFSGYCTNRETAGKVGDTRSRGSNRADGWASIPIVRISNVGLVPGAGSPDDLIADVKRGICIEGHDSFSIDQKRFNFQFGGDAFWLIENGKRSHMLRDVIYTGITPEFWGSCDGIAGPEHRRRFGFINCGKGQPGQSGWMTHAASHARFRGVKVIRGETKA